MMVSDSKPILKPQHVEMYVCAKKNQRQYTYTIKHLVPTKLDITHACVHYWSAFLPYILVHFIHFASRWRQQQNATAKANVLVRIFCWFSMD